MFLTHDVSANDPNCEANPCKALRDLLEHRKDVESVRYLTRDEAYEDAISKIPQFKDVASKDAFPASFIVKLDESRRRQGIRRRRWSCQPGVQRVLNQKN